MHIPLSDSFLYFASIIIGVAAILALLYGFGYFVIKDASVPTPKKTSTLTIVVVMAVGAILFGRHLFAHTSGEVARSLISKDDERHELLTGTVTSFELSNEGYGSFLAHLTVRDEKDTEWHVTTSFERLLPIDPLKVGIRVRFPRHYFITKSVSLTRADIIWESYFNEARIGKPPLTFLKD